MRSKTGFLIAVCVFASIGGQLWAETVPPKELVAFAQTHCIECHWPKKQKGDFRVDELKISENAADAKYWRTVRDQLHSGDMPPEDAKQPSPEDVEKITAWIDAELERASLALAGQRPETVLRRLNRLEYETTVEDILGVLGTYAAWFPEDAKFGGRYNHGQHLAFEAGAAPLANLYVSILNQFGLADKTFATGTGPLMGLEV